MNDNVPVETPAPPPMQAEVPVNENQVQPQQPLGQQAPPKPPGQEEAKSSQHARREAIEKAFKRAQEGQEEAQRRPAAKRPASANDNQRPPANDNQAAQEPAKPAQERYREGGRFARAPAQPGEAQPAEAPPKYAPLDERAPYRDPPPRLSEAARQDWHGTPETVRGAVHQMHKEFAGAYERYRGDAEVMDTIRPYHELARQHGTTLQKALGNYIQMEQKLRSDVVGGLDVIVRNLGMKHPNGQPVTLRDVAYHIANMQPGQHQMVQQQNAQVSQEMRIGQLHQMVEQLATGIGQMQYQNRFQQTRSAVDVFADSHPRFDELADLIKQELDLGFDLEQAYARAEMLRPGNGGRGNGTAHAVQTRTTPAQTRRTSISGAPDAGPATGRRGGNDNSKPPSRREALERAARRLSGV